MLRHLSIRPILGSPEAKCNINDFSHFIWHRMCGGIAVNAVNNQPGEPGTPAAPIASGAGPDCRPRFKTAPDPST
jgi:hypothetical protein